MWVQRVGSVLHADGNESVAEMAKLPLGKPMHCVLRRPRNLQHHKLYWTLVNRIATGVGAEPQNISDLLKIATGHCVIMRSKSYGELCMPRSISFAAMDQDDFSIFFERCLQTIFEEWGISKESLGDLPL
jgi:hypothetical protein